MSGSKVSCGCQTTPTDPYQESLEAVWHDPTSYDPNKHAPPYMPPKLAMAKKASVQKTVATLVDSKVAQDFFVASTPLSSVLSVLQAAAFLHKTHHWQTHGNQYYADHLLFDRLYTESQSFIDQVAERAVGSTNVEAVDAKSQVRAISAIVAVVAREAEPESMVRASLRVEALVLAVINQCLETLKARGGLTNGIDNLLQGAADLHETFVYLLRQRLPSAYSYGR